MKKKYEKPRMRSIQLQGQVHLLSGSIQNEVNSYQKGTDFNIGDEDED